MKVELKRTWFAPVETGPMSDRRVVSGTLYSAGVHDDMPDTLRDRLPKSAKVLGKSDTEVETVREYPETEVLSEHDPIRSAGDHEAELIANAEAERKHNDEVKRKRNEGLARGRAKAAANRAAKKAGKEKGE